MPDEVRTRGNYQKRKGPYPLGEFPETFAGLLAGQLTYRSWAGATDVSGDDFANIFANVVGGQHLAKPLGVADVEWENCAWTVKTVKNNYPFRAERIRLISGRNSPSFSGHIQNVHEDIQRTGKIVLNIWNQRVDEALKRFEELRCLTMIRNWGTGEFCVFEHEVHRFIPSDYNWKVNDKGNFQAYDKKDAHQFTWQPHGSQFTIIAEVPRTTLKFRILRGPQKMTVDQLLAEVGFGPDWYEVVR